MNGYAVFGACLFLFAAVTLAFNWRLSVTQKRIAEKRPSVSEQEFVEALVLEGLLEPCAAKLHELAKDYYFRALAPHPDDFLDGFLKIDPEDVEDIVEELWQLTGAPRPTPESPLNIPGRLSWRSLARFVAQQSLLRSGGSRLYN